MTNFEFYKDEIQKIIDEGDDAIAIVDDKPVPCASVCGCKDCLFNGISCAKGVTKWLYEEHVEKPTITPQEKRFLEACSPGCYIARDANNTLFIYSNKPRKGVTVWSMIGEGSSFEWLWRLFNLNANSDNFSFITWKDKEPWSVEDLLKLEVKEVK